MFGMPVLNLGKKPFAGLVDDGINFKLPVGSEDIKKALAITGAHLFQPEMHGKKGPLMKQWRKSLSRGGNLLSYPALRD